MPKAKLARPKTTPEASEQFNGSFRNRSFVSVDQITSRSEIDELFCKAQEMDERVKNKIQGTELVDATVALLFYQPSTRTFTSFKAASEWLGCQRLIDVHGMSAYSSAVKGESLQDTIRSIQMTTASDLVVLRHPDDDSSEIAANATSMPIINAGSGRKEHPTQAVLDLYTIQQELGRLSDITATMTGDLRNGRTIKSLSKLLVLAGDNIRFNFVSPPVLRMPNDIVQLLESLGAKVSIGNNGDLDDAISKTDVLYVTRVQKEWFTLQAIEDLKKDLGDKLAGLDPDILQTLAENLGQSGYEKAVAGYVIDESKMSLAKENMIVMHPLPRVGEIAYEVDSDPRAAYFRQMRYGLVTRMALLAAILGKA